MTTNTNPENAPATENKGKLARFGGFLADLFEALTDDSARQELFRQISDGEVEVIFANGEYRIVSSTTAPVTFSRLASLLGPIDFSQPEEDRLEDNVSFLLSLIGAFPLGNLAKEMTAGKIEVIQIDSVAYGLRHKETGRIHTAQDLKQMGA